MHSELFCLDASLKNAPVFPPDIEPLPMAGQPLKAVVVGGGSGAPISIRTLRALGFDTSVVVAMADDGGSTGVLRRVADVTAPGDVRKCLGALASDEHRDLVFALQTRLSFDNDHALGNLLLSILENNAGSFKQAIAICENLLGCTGHVFPSTYSKVSLSAQTVDGRIIVGQSNICKAVAPISRVWLNSYEDIVANPDACQALEEADVIVLGPGSLFTSVLPNVAVEGVLQAIRASHAVRVYICSISDSQGETAGMAASDYVHALTDHGMDGCLDYVLANGPADRNASGITFVTLGDADASQGVGGARVLVRDLADDDAITWHSPKKLARAIAEVVNECHLIQR